MFCKEVHVGNLVAFCLRILKFFKVGGRTICWQSSVHVFTLFFIGFIGNEVPSILDKFESIPNWVFKTHLAFLQHDLCLGERVIVTVNLRSYMVFCNGTLPRFEGVLKAFHLAINKVLRLVVDNQLDVQCLELSN